MREHWLRLHLVTADGTKHDVHPSSVKLAVDMDWTPYVQVTITCPRAEVEDLPVLDLFAHIEAATLDARWITPERLARTATSCAGMTAAGVTATAVASALIQQGAATANGPYDVLDLSLRVSRITPGDGAATIQCGGDELRLADLAVFLSGGSWGTNDSTTGETIGNALAVLGYALEPPGQYDHTLYADPPLQDGDSLLTWVQTLLSGHDERLVQDIDGKWRIIPITNLPQEVGSLELGPADVISSKTEQTTQDDWADGAYTAGDSPLAIGADGQPIYWPAAGLALTAEQHINRIHRMREWTPGTRDEHLGQTPEKLAAAAARYRAKLAPHTIVVPAMVARAQPGRPISLADGTDLGVIKSASTDLTAPYETTIETRSL